MISHNSRLLLPTLYILSLHSPGIEPGSRVPQTRVLSVELRVRTQRKDTNLKVSTFVQSHPKEVHDFFQHPLGDTVSKRCGSR